MPDMAITSNNRCRSLQETFPVAVSLAFSSLKPHTQASVVAQVSHSSSRLQALMGPSVLANILVAHQLQALKDLFDLANR